MYINAYKETCDNLYLVKGPSLLPMISYEIEKILYKEDVCETAQDFLPKLKEIKRFADRYDDVASFILKLKENVHIEIQGLNSSLNAPQATTFGSASNTLITTLILWTTLLTHPSLNTSTISIRKDTLCYSS